MKKKFTLLIAALALLAFLTPPLAVMGQTSSTKTEGFETKTAATNYQGTVTINENESDCGIGWSIYYGCVSTNNNINGNNSAQMRWYSSATSSLPYLMSTTAVEDLTSVAFKAKVGNTNVKMDVSYSSNGNEWANLATGTGVTFENANSVQEFSYNIPTGGKYIKIGVSENSTAPTSGNYAFIVDDVVFTYTASATTTYTVTYKANGGTGEDYVVANITSGSTHTIIGIGDVNFTAPNNKSFVKWKDNNNIEYDEGDEITVESNITLNAQWQLSGSYLFYESFDQCNGTGGNDDSWSGSIASSALTSDNEDWTFANGNGANKCAKFGTASKLGSAQTPDITHTGNVTLTFKAGAWNGNSENTTLKLSATSGNLSASTVTLVKGEWTTYTINITDIETSTKIKFEGNSASNSRFFLDEVLVVEAAVTSVATPTFSLAEGIYTETQVAISCETEDATIYYTTDGTDPDNESAQYTAAITISQTTTLKAIAILNEESSYVAEATYTIVTIEHAGTEADPYTVADARNAIDANTGTTGVYATGIVSKIETEWSTQYNNITFNFVDNEGDTDFLQAYRCVSGTGVDASQVAVGDVVVVHGNLTKYSSTYEFGSGCQLVSLVHTVAGDDSGQATLNGIDAGMTYVVPSGVTLTFNGTNNGTASNLIIKDGGQLIHTEAVDATLQKNIAHYTSKDGASGWYTVASPVNDASVSTTLGIGTYDLYRYNEPTHYWWNQQGSAHSFTTLSRGQGYLYANNADKVVSFAGSMVATNATVTVQLSYTTAAGDLKGYNLVGNPFTRNLTSSDAIKIGSTDLSTYYYVAGGSDLVSANISERDIKTGEGFFVQATAVGQDLVFNPTSKGETAAKPAYVCIEAGDESFMDRAYVQVGQGNTLRKMTLNDNVAHVYVLHNEADYAAATIEAAEGEMPVCFKAAHDGQYTLNVNTKGLDADYLHLIDNFTGADIDLIASPSYTFDAKAADHACRFRLMFDASENNGASTLATAFAYLSNGEIVITGAEADATLQIMDMTGRVVAIRDAARNVSTAGMPAGVYVLRLVNGSDVKTQKMVIR